MGNKTRGILIGSLSGALLGAGIAWLLVSRQDQSPQGRPAGSRKGARASTNDWFKLGMSIMQAGRQVANILRLD